MHVSQYPVHQDGQFVRKREDRDRKALDATRRKAAPNALRERRRVTAPMRNTAAVRLAPMPLVFYFGGGLPPETAVRGDGRGQLTKCFSVRTARRSSPTSVRIVCPAPVLMP